MLPIRDRNPSGLTPYVTWGLIVINVAVFLSYWPLGTDESVNAVFRQWGMVPSRLSAGQGLVTMGTLGDRIGRRKPFLLVANLMIGLSVWLMASGSTVWVFVAVATSGIWFDAVMGISITTVADTKGIGPALAGTAVGFLFAVQEVGGILSPPIGNRLALINPAYAFFFWGALALIGMIFFALYRQE